PGGPGLETTIRGIPWRDPARNGALSGRRPYPQPWSRAMNERVIFTEALDRETPEDRAAYLDAACAGDPALRARVEALLRSHEQAGEFPGKLAPQRLAEEFAARGPDHTR